MRIIVDDLARYPVRFLQAKTYSIRWAKGSYQVGFTVFPRGHYNHRRLPMIAEKMRRYILLQYMHGQKSDDPLSMGGTFDDLRDAKAFAEDHMRDFNEIVDSDTWAVVWRLNKGAPSANPTSSVLG